jgi:hypothetical protein
VNSTSSIPPKLKTAPAPYWSLSLITPFIAGSLFYANSPLICSIGFDIDKNTKSSLSKLSTDNALKSRLGPWSSSNRYAITYLGLVTSETYWLETELKAWLAICRMSDSKLSSISYITVSKISFSSKSLGTLMII